MASDLGDTAPELDASDASLPTDEETNLTMEGSGGSLAVDQMGKAANNDNDGEVENTDEKYNNGDGKALVVRDSRTLTPLEQLIPEIMIYFLEFVDILTRIKLAAASTSLQRLIHRQCSALWVTIDLSYAKVPVAITDDALATLLHRVNARDVTKFLILTGRDYRGDGLEPLRHSQVLERFLINAYPPVHFSVATATNILRTMLPHNLTEVRFPYETNNEETLKHDFLLELSQVVRQRAIDRGTECIACHHPVQHASVQIIPDICGPRPTRCFSCLKYFCRTSACPVEVRDCFHCGVASCSGCNKIQKCGGCRESSCGRCDSFSRPCIYCNQVFCYWECDGNEITCYHCDKAVCTDCARKHGDDSIHVCNEGGFENTHCSDCLKHLTCECCEEVDCDVEHVPCRKCLMLMCEACTASYTTCFGCKKSICLDCEEEGENDAWWCQFCEKRFCGDCCQVSRCPCELTFCSHHDCVYSHLKDCTVLRHNKRARTDENFGGTSP